MLKFLRRRSSFIAVIDVLIDPPDTYLACAEYEMVPYVVN